MLDNWLSPISISDLLHRELETEHFGHHLLIHSKEEGLPDLKEVALAIVGLSPDSANTFRKYFYPLSFPFSNLRIADLGNLRKQSVEFSISALAEIRAAGILPILIGDDTAFVQALYRALMLNFESINMVVVDERVPVNPDNKKDPQAYLNPLLLGKVDHLLQLGIIGHQIHFIPPDLLHYMQEENFDAVRLGDARANIAEVEPIIRNADLAGINLQAMRASEFPAVKSPSPSGFQLEEACQLARYAGMSDKLKGFYLLGYDVNADPNGLSAFAMAEMIWYFIEGYYHRKGDYPMSTEGLTEYIVELKQYDYPITFWKSNWSGRWWIQVPMKVRKRHLRHRLVPCSYQDYKLACQDKLPERLINAFKRFA